MLTAATVLRIIELSLEIWLETLKSLPPEQRAAMAERHEKRMQFWEDLFERLQPKEGK